MLQNVSHLSHPSCGTKVGMSSSSHPDAVQYYVRLTRVFDHTRESCIRLGYPVSTRRRLQQVIRQEEALARRVIGHELANKLFGVLYVPITITEDADVDIQ
jgi:hypothetical protein